MKNMVQYTVLPNCTGNCDFCLRDERVFLKKGQILENIELIKKQIKEYMNCPKCDGKIVEKKTKRGKIFYGCNNYPKCDFASWYEPVKECSKCHNIMVKKKDGIECLECGEKE